MTAYGKLNLLAVLGLPAVATLAAAITPALDSPGAGSFLTIFLMNVAVMLVGGLGASLLLRGAAKAGGAGSRMALLPSLVPALIGSGWYLYRSIVPEAIAPGREFLAAPLYLVLMSIALWIAAGIAGRVVRAGRGGAELHGLRFVPYGEVGGRPNIVVDGAALSSTVLTLSHWPNNTTPERFRRDTSTATALAFAERHDPCRVAGIVTNNHFDEDGLLSMFAVLDPGRALRYRELLADAASAGDFGTFRTRNAARLCFVIEAHANPELSPLPRTVFGGTSAMRVAALYRHLLRRLPRWLASLGAYRRYWHAQDEHLEASEALVASGQVVIEEEPELDLATVRVPAQLPPRPAWRYLRREQAVIHPFAIHNATRCGRLVRIQGRRIEVQYRYESWVQLASRRPAMRVDLAPFCRWLNRREENGTWVWDDTLGIAPRLHMKEGVPTSIPPALFLRHLRRELVSRPPLWDPYDWPVKRRSAKGVNV